MDIRFAHRVALKLLIVMSLSVLADRHAQAATVEYIHTDALGSPVAVTNAAGVVIERTEYAPYGEQLNRAEDDGPGYTGHVVDKTTGLNYMQQRYYDPGVGRFLSMDPVTVDGNTGGNFNRYWYANNNPYKFTDPDGRQSAADRFNDAFAKAHGRKDPEPKESPQQIYDKASKAAERSGLPGAHNGEQDAARHCMGSCETARQHGSETALVLGEANEKRGDLTHNQSSEEKEMDRHNNALGREIGKTADSWTVCRTSCLDAVESGATINSIPEEQHPYREYEDNEK